jgi:hypothetical protein
LLDGFIIHISEKKKDIIILKNNSHGLEVRRLQRLVPIFEDEKKRKSTSNCDTIQ